MTSQFKKKMNRHGLFERVVGEKYFFSKKQKWLMFAKLHLHQSQDFWNNVFWTDETIMHRAMFGKIQTPHINCQHNGGCEKIWVCFAAAGLRHLTVIEPNMNSFEY